MVMRELLIVPFMNYARAVNWASIRTYLDQVVLSQALNARIAMRQKL